MIRKMEEKDFNSVYRLGKILHENYQNLYNLEEVINTNYFHTYVFEEDEKILGFLMYTKIENIIEILDIVVDEKQRRKKIATNLLDRLITNAKIDDKILLEVNVKNQTAIDLYEKFGFQTIHTRKKYYKNEDAYVMERRIENE